MSPCQPECPISNGNELEMKVVVAFLCIHTRSSPCVFRLLSLLSVRSFSCYAICTNFVSVCLCVVIRVQQYVMTWTVWW